MSGSLLTNETSELDLLDQRPFDQTDFDILKSHEAVVDGLAMLIELPPVKSFCTLCGI